MDEKKDIELIDRYLKNDLSIQERGDFNARLEKDLAFNDLYQFINNLRIVAKVKGREEIRERLSDLFKEVPKPEMDKTKSPFIDVITIKSYFEHMKLRPIYAIAASVIILTISVIILLVLVGVPPNTENIAQRELKKREILNSNVDNIIYYSKSIDSFKVVPDNIISEDFGFAKIESTKSSPLIIKLLVDKGPSLKYILYSDTLILMGSVNKSHLKNVFNFPRFYIMGYSEKFYRVKKIYRTMLPLCEETDSVIIQAILKPQ